VRAARRGQGWYGGINSRLSRLPTHIGWYRDALTSSGSHQATGCVIVNRLALAAESPAEVADLSDRYLAATLRAYARDHPVEEVSRHVALLGTPAEIVTRVQQYADAGVTHLFARVSLDEMPVEVPLRTIELFGREVIPRFQQSGRL
jgi:alkanesulfonate monooxygenase SsuD/methylene tetrahydromethanopterin reductase-like flavin-dependent oxidoreductase (luciferase family)